MGRLVVVSNRVVGPADTRAGGLAIALRAALAEHGGLWFGWSGRRAAEMAARPRQRDGDVEYLTLDLPAADVEAYYDGFANRTLWPLLHWRLDLVDYRRDTQAGYLRVNAQLADVLARELRPDDRVWVHDYHLIPLGRCLRERGVGNRLGFFLHVPLPPAELLEALPGHRLLFPALASYDLVGFQTERDRQHLLDYFAATRPAAPSPRTGTFGVGIDAAGLSTLAAAASKRQAVRRLSTSLAGRRLAIGVDRLDYSKGLPERFRAFGRHLDRHPGLRGRLTYLQIAPTSRDEVPEYRRLRGELDALAGHINGAHASPDWTPVRYVNRNFGHELLAGFYRVADIGLVTPLRDGMNLVAKEYVAAQDPDDPGVLVLSRFAGAAADMEEALLVNPHDVDGIADAIAQAQEMPLAERRERWEALMARVAAQDVGAWRRGFLEALG